MIPDFAQGTAHIHMVLDPPPVDNPCRLQGSFGGNQIFIVRYEFDKPSELR